MNSNSFYDKRIQESINTLTADELASRVAYEIGEIDLDATKMYLQGIVLMNARGEGINQVVVPERYTGWVR